MTIVKVAVIGLGNMGKHHVRNYSELDKSKLVAVCDLQNEVEQLFQERKDKLKTAKSNVEEQVAAFQEFNRYLIITLNRVDLSATLKAYHDFLKEALFDV